MSFAAAVGRHWLSGSSSSKLSTGAMLLMGALSSTATAVTFCDDGKKGDSLTDRLFPKNAKGETDWSAAVVKMQSNQFWDVIAKQAGSQVQGAVDSGIPTQLSYGFISGYCSGMAMKKVGKVAAGIFGMGFMTLQFLSYSGYVHGTLILWSRSNENGEADRVIHNPHSPFFFVISPCFFLQWTTSRSKSTCATPWT
jgi:hypothetical protein